MWSRPDRGGGSMPELVDFAPELVELTARAIATARTARVQGAQWTWDSLPISPAGAELWRETYRDEARTVLAAQAAAGALVEPSEAKV